MWKRRRSTDKRYPGDNRLILPKSPYRRQGLAPRCRLVSSWGWSRSQGAGCSPVKEARELGLERRSSLRLRGAIRGCPPAHIGETLMSPPNGTFRAIPREGRHMEAVEASYLAGFLDGMEAFTSNSSDKLAIASGITSEREHVTISTHDRARRSRANSLDDRCGLCARQRNS